MSNTGVPFTVKVYVPFVAPAPTMKVADKLPPEAEHAKLEMKPGMVRLFGEDVMVHEVSDGEKPLPVMLTEVPGREPSGGDPRLGFIVSALVAVRMNMASP